MLKWHSWFILFVLFVFGGFLITPNANASKDKTSTTRSAPHVQAGRAQGHGGVNRSAPHGQVGGAQGHGGNTRGIAGHGSAGRGAIGHGNVHGGHGAGGHHFSHHNYHHMNAHDRRMWGGGRWRHEEYMGRMGYWWIVGGAWYFYDTPVYPYPLEVATVMYDEPAAAVVVPVERPAPAVFAPQVQTVRYYCPGVGYAPSVQSCPGGWVTQPMR